MGRSTNFSEQDVLAAKKFIEEFKGTPELWGALSVAISAVTGATLEQVGEIVGRDKSTVTRARSRFCRQKEGSPSAVQQKHGGRRNELLSVKDEKEFLDPWIESAKAGKILVIPPIHKALEQRTGKKVAKSTVYNILARHGWRKVQPDTRHPKSDPDAQEDFKKNSPKLLHPLAKWLPPKA